MSGRVLSNMQGERVDGMRGAKERSVVVIFVSEQAKLASSPLSPYHPRLAIMAAAFRITRWRPDANRTTLSSCLSCRKR